MEQVRPSVQWFVEQMEKKLKENDHKKHWSRVHNSYLLQRLNQEFHELRSALQEYREGSSSAEEIIFEAADVANFAMMIADNMREDQAKDRRG